MANNLSSDKTNIETNRSSPLLKHRVGDAANTWLEKNRSLVLRQTPVWAQSLAIILVSVGGIAVVGATIFRIDEVVSVNGQLKSIGGTVQVKSPVGGKVSDVFFKDAQQVEKGQALMRFDTRQVATEKLILEKQILFEKNQFESQLKAYQSQLATVANRRKVAEARIQTKKITIEEMGNLVIQGGYQRLRFLEEKDQLFGLETQLSDLDEQQDRINIEIEKTTLSSQQSIDRLNAELKKAELRLQYQNIVSPASGIVFNPQVAPEGVIASGERIVSIVPQKGLYAEVFVSNKDIGYIKINQEAKVRIDAFPFSRYGELPAYITQIGADALPPDSTYNFYRFPVKLKLKRYQLERDGISIPLKSGMSVTTNLKLRDKRVISLISDIFVDQTDSIKSIRQQ
mgnify:CR=1 FL=1